METREQVASRIRGRGYTAIDDLFALTDYEFEQWCGETAKGNISDAERSWLESDLDLAARWVDGLEALIDSADTQLEHAEYQLEDLVESGDVDAIEELEQRQADWIPKVKTFKRKVTKCLREARRNLERIQREQVDPARIGELEDAIRQHRISVEYGDDEEADDADTVLWAFVDHG